LIPPDTPHAGLLRLARGGVGRIPLNFIAKVGELGCRRPLQFKDNSRSQDNGHVIVISREFQNTERYEALTRNEQPVNINAALSYPIL
jgi:hypothetical protein